MGIHLSINQSFHQSVVCVESVVKGTKLNSIICCSISTLSYDGEKVKSMGREGCLGLDKSDKWRSDIGDGQST